MSYSKIKKVRLSKYDKIWSRLVRERDGACQYCDKTEYLAAHHYIRRGVKSTRLVLENGITLCPGCHTFNPNFSAHRTPDAFKKWFEEKFPERAKGMQTREKMYMSERQAIKEFEELNVQ